MWFTEDMPPSRHAPRTGRAQPRRGRGLRPRLRRGQPARATSRCCASPTCSAPTSSRRSPARSSCRSCRRCSASTRGSSSCTRTTSIRSILFVLDNDLRRRLQRRRRRPAAVVRGRRASAASARSRCRRSARRSLLWPLRRLGLVDLPDEYLAPAALRPRRRQPQAQGAGLRLRVHVGRGRAGVRRGGPAPRAPSATTSRRTATSATSSSSSATRPPSSATPRPRPDGHRPRPAPATPRQSRSTDLAHQRYRSAEQRLGPASAISRRGAPVRRAVGGRPRRTPRRRRRSGPERPSTTSMPSHPTVVVTSGSRLASASTTLSRVPDPEADRHDGDASAGRARTDDVRHRSDQLDPRRSTPRSDTASAPRPTMRSVGVGIGRPRPTGSDLAHEPSSGVGVRRVARARRRTGIVGAVPAAASGRRARRRRLARRWR